jgi:hypothetical protein
VLFGPTTFSFKHRAQILAGGVLVASIANIPSIWLATLAPDRFVFGNIGYATLSTAYYRSLPNAFGMTFITKLGSSLSKFVTDPCNLIILAAFLATILARFSSRYQIFQSRDKSFRSEFDFTLALIGCLWVGAMGPTPMMQQYNYMLVPFMVLVIFYAIRLVKEDRVILRKLTRLTAIVAIVFGGTGLLRWYWSVIYLPVPSHWQPMVQHREADWIRDMTGPGARILTMESEIPLEAGLEIYPEYATGRFVLLVEKFETPALRRKYDLVGPTELPAILAKRPPDAVFVRSSHGCDEAFIDYAKANHFEQHQAPDGTSILWLNPICKPVRNPDQVVATLSDKCVLAPGLRH